LSEANYIKFGNDIDRSYALENHVLDYRSQGDSIVTTVAHRGQISHLLKTLKIKGGMGKCMKG